MADKMLNAFDVWITAQGVKSRTRLRSVDNVSLEGVERLRELILEFAIQGKLVTQSIDDEPAIELVKKIALDKTKLVEEGRLKTQKLSTDLAENEKMFDCPRNWKWCKLQSLVYVLGDGIHGTPLYTPGTKYFFVNGNNLKDGVIQIFGDTKTVSKEELLKHKKDLTSNTVLVSINGTLGNVAFYNGEEIMLGKSACYFSLSPRVSKEFIRKVIESPYFKRYANDKATGTTIRNLGLKAMNEFPICLPPLAEQHRIVAKADELMALCDALEQQETHHLKSHQLLVETLLGTLTRAADANEFQHAWNKLYAHFDDLFTTEDSIDQLKQTILQLAVMGKLVPQDPNDEPASELLKRIKQANSVNKKRSKDKTLTSVINDSDVQFLLPNGWVWVRLAEIISISSGDGLTASNMNSEGAIPVFGGNGINGFHDSANVDKPTLVIGRVGYYCGSVHITPQVAWVTDNAFITTFSEENIDINFLYWLLKGTDLKENDSATAQPVISGRKIYPIIVGLPPLNEQREIAAKIDELFALCDRLKERIAEAQRAANMMAEGVGV